MTRITPAAGGRPNSNGTRRRAGGSPVCVPPTVGFAIAERAVRVRYPSPSGGARLLAWLEGIVRLGGPIWFERRLITHLDALARTPVVSTG